MRDFCPSPSRLSLGQQAQTDFEGSPLRLSRIRVESAGESSDSANCHLRNDLQRVKITTSLEKAMQCTSVHMLAEQKLACEMRPSKSSTSRSTSPHGKNV